MALALVHVIMVEEGVVPDVANDAALNTERETAEAEAAAAVAKAARAQKYDNMFSSIEALTATLMPCGKESHPELSIIGASKFETHKRRCIHNDCANRIWRAGEACGFEGVFGAPCPTEMGDEPAEWRRWEKRLRSVNDEGKEFHALEWVPAHGSRKGLWSELLPAIIDTLPHMWSDDLMQQSVRVYEDRKSGRHLYELSKSRRVVTTPQLLADAMDVVVLWAEQRLEPPAVARPSGLSRQFVTLKALLRLAEAAEKPPAAVVQQVARAVALRNAQRAVELRRPTSPHRPMKRCCCWQPLKLVASGTANLVNLAVS